MTSVHILCTDPSFLGSSREKKQDCFLLKYFFFSLSSFDTFPSSNHPSLKRIQTIYNHITALFCLHLKVLFKTNLCLYLRVCVCVCVCESCLVILNFLQPHGLYGPWNSPGQNTRVGLSLLQGIFPTQGSNPSLPHYRWIRYQLSHRKSSTYPCPGTLMVSFIPPFLSLHIGEKKGKGE